MKKTTSNSLWTIQTVANLLCHRNCGMYLYLKTYSGQDGLYAGGIPSRPAWSDRLAAIMKMMYDGINAPAAGCPVR